MVKAVNTSENLLNEICEIIYSLYWAKEITIVQLMLQVTI